MKYLVVGRGDINFGCHVAEVKMGESGYLGIPASGNICVRVVWVNPKNDSAQLGRVWYTPKSVLKPIGRVLNA